MQNDQPSHEMLLAALTRVVKKSVTDGLPPVCIALSDAQGELVALQRSPGTPGRTVHIAIAKAYTAARMGIGTAAFKQRLLSEQQTLADFMDTGFTSLPGGLPIKSDAAVVAAVGISGRSPEQDAQLAEVFLSVLAELSSETSA